MVFHFFCGLLVHKQLLCVRFVMSGSLLSVDRINKVFLDGDGKCLEVLRGVTADFKPGNSYAITGASGCGKSTLLHVLAGLEEPTSGAVMFGGESLYGMPQLKRQMLLNKSFGLVFQEPYLIKELTILENVMIKGLICGLSRTECEKRAMSLLSAVELSHMAKNYPSTLSGGEKQRISVARAIFNEPDFVLADEPTGSLDDDSGDIVIDLLSGHYRKDKFGLIVVSHDPKVAKAMDRVMVLRSGVLEVAQL